jgi:hypothetical protein
MKGPPRVTWRCGTDQSMLPPEFDMPLVIEEVDTHTTEDGNGEVIITYRSAEFDCDHG